MVSLKLAMLENILDYEVNRKEEIIAKLQRHSLIQTKNGFTKFRVTNIDKEDVMYLEQWVDNINASLKVQSFKCYMGNKYYFVNNYIVDFKPLLGSYYDKEGSVLNIKG